ncbi:hypothetical protein BZG35_00225 [Brevundimonas sp. LM2]|nr:hypothetical protein BZG35_00225 [Brevundimonas sp. LM2]
MFGQTAETPGRAATPPIDGPVPSVHLRLKQATRLDHETVDQAMSGFDLTDRDAYGAFLQLNHTAMIALRPHWRAADAVDFDALVEALAADLAALGLRPSPPADPLAGRIDGLGLSYVVRGSRLGSRILRRRVGPGLPTAYLDLRLGEPWARLLDQLTARGTADPDDTTALIAGARATFAVYERLARPMAAAA